MGVFNPVDDDYRWLKVSASPQFRLCEDTPFQVFSTFEDVTKLRRLDAQRRAANLFATELLESVRDGFLALDRDLRVTYINGAAEALLGPGGCLAVVSFHSLEDRRVKTFLQARSGSASRPSRHMPIDTVVAGAPTFQFIKRGAIKPTAAETRANPRARSARLRWAVRTEAPA